MKTYTNLYMEIPSTVIQIKNMQIIEELNEHGLAVVKIITHDEDEYTVIDSLNSKVDVKLVLVNNETPTIIFFGVPTKVTMQKVNNTYNVELELKSKSVILDFKRVRRSFQNKDNPYGNLFNSIVEGKATIFDAASIGALQNESLIQYDETDWEFLKRMASKLKAKLSTNIRVSNPYIVIGKQRGSDFIQDDSNFALTQELEGFLKSQINYDGWRLEHKLCYCLQSLNEYALYDKVTFQDVVFTVIKKETTLTDGIVTYTYYLAKESSIRQDLIENKNILGVSINGKVLDIRPDRVKLHLSIDQNQPIEEAFWYKLLTAYTNEGQTGFYSMPQKGDEVELYFPFSHKEDAYVRTVNRKDGQTNLKIFNPSVKYYGNIHRKELMLAPTELQLTATNGLILINMDDKDGIEITSSDCVNIRCNSSMEITGAKIGLRAGREIVLATKKSSLIIDRTIDFSASGGVSGI